MDDNKKFGDVSQEDIDMAKKAAPDDLKEKQPVNVMDEVFEWAESFVFAMFMVILIFTFFFRIVLVQGPSMRETLQDQDRLIITHIIIHLKRAISLLSTAKSSAKLSSSVLSAQAVIRLSLIIITTPLQ